MVRGITTMGVKPVSKPMETLRSENFEMASMGNQYEVTVAHREIGRKEEIDVIANSGSANPSETKVIFRVDDKQNRVARYRDVRPQELGKPQSVHIRALNRFGWYCENVSFEEVSLSAFGSVRPALDFIDDVLGGVIRMDDSPLRDAPFALDMIETAQTAVAWVNGTLEARKHVDKAGYLDKYGFDEPPSIIRASFAPESQHELEFCRSNLVSHSSDDPYLAILAAPLMNYRFGTDVTWREMWEAGDDHPLIIDAHRDVDSHEDVMKRENVRPESFAAQFTAASDPDRYFDPPSREWQTVEAEVEEE